MIITVDTSKDSPAQMRKAADLLLRLAGDTPAAPSRVVEPSPDLMGMFGAQDSDDDTPKEPDFDGAGIVPY